MFDPELYRSKQEVETWRARDPIALYRARLLERGWLTASELAAMESDVDAEIADAVAFAERGRLEPIEDLCKDVMTPEEPR
jgi:TPP-dependent pyruvate/acetoin dehydrogenase alpha subunit